MERIIITGASGHIGSFILNELVKKGYQIIALKLKSDKAINISNDNVKYVIGDIRDNKLMSSLIQKGDTIIHLAGIISISNSKKDLIYDVNYLATKNIADICLQVGARLIYTSSVHVLKAIKNQKITEDVGFNVKSKRGPYEYSKSLATQYIFDLFKKGLNGVVLYPSAIIGPNDVFVGEVSNALMMIYKKRMPAYIKGGYSFVDVRDVANAIINAVEHPEITKNGYILTSDYISIKKLVKTIYDHCGYKHFPIYCPLPFVYLGLPFISLYSKIFHKTPIFTKVMLKTVLSNGDFDNSKAKKDLDFNPRPLINSIVDQIDWLKKEHSELF